MRSSTLKLEKPGFPVQEVRFLSFFFGFGGTIDLSLVTTAFVT